MFVSVPYLVMCSSIVLRILVPLMCYFKYCRCTICLMMVRISSPSFYLMFQISVLYLSILQYRFYSLLSIFKNQNYHNNYGCCQNLEATVNCSPINCKKGCNFPVMGTQTTKICMCFKSLQKCVNNFKKN